MVNYNIKSYGVALSSLLLLIGTQNIFGQEESANLDTQSTYHNQLFFNRFFINPTFSLVRENKSYLNILNRNQYTSFEDNRQNYFLGFSNKLNERTALGIGVYSQWSGVVQEFGFNANYATSVRLGDKSRLTFGTNLTYFTEGLDKNRVVVTNDDARLSEARKESKLAIQPGLTLSLGSFDFGLYAQDLLKYNQTTNEFLTNLSQRSVKASLQYTHTFNSQKGLFENARLMPLIQLGQNNDNQYSFAGSLLLDMPNYGWLQTNFDETYGMSLGIGFNLSRKMSLGYLMEKDVAQKDADLGWNHEVSLAYTFSKTDGSEDWAENSQDEKIDRIVRNYEEQILALTASQNRTPDEELKKNELAINKLAYENRMILDQLILRQDSIETARNKAFEKRFETIVRSVRTDIKNSIRSNLRELNTNQNTALAVNTAESKPIEEEKYSNFKELPIKLLNQSNIVGAQSGYYVIANVYKSKKYLDAFMIDLKKKGLNAKKFYNKENGLHYVYLADYNHKEDAKTAYVSNLNGKYQDEKWIMEVANNSTIVLNSYDN